MHAAAKAIIGIILIIIGLWLLVPSNPSYGLTAIKPKSLAIFDWWSDFLIVLKGIIPPTIIILGALIVWIESEELKTPVVPEIEEEPKTKKPSKKKAKRKR
ncbi:MAG: hypothetical protein J7K87_03130 [Candidatus Aenigmarchaeota archaeon]|nr:hypothetical protein [Candidatus Aenigmarchaeota archaeon]